MQHQFFKLKIPCKSYLQKFFVANFANENQQYFLNKKTLIGMVIHNELYKSNHSNFYLTKDKKVITKKETKNCFYNSYIIVHAPIYLMNTKGYDITNECISRINEYIELLFEQQLNFFATQRNISVYNGNNRRQAIEDFANYYSIEIDEDISLDGLVKSDYRLRVGLNPKAPLLEDRMMQLVLPFEFS